jgi:hypothetical protein
MSLLDTWNEEILVFPETEWLSPDGNVMTGVRPDAVGIPAKAEVQVQAASGTSARRSEQDNEGFESEENYALRFPRAEAARIGELGPQSQIEWAGVRWSLVGFARRYNGSRRTRRAWYSIRRS